MQGNYDNLDSFGALRAMVEDLELRQEKDWKGNAGDALTVTFRHVRTFYMAVPPFLYSGIAGCCRSAGLRRKSDRFILEKPFGKDTESCAELCAGINEALSESQLYRIDHYLGKELVMNVLVMRFANISFNAIWNRHHIEVFVELQNRLIKIELRISHAPVRPSAVQRNDRDCRSGRILRRVWYHKV
jgi:glucose-6-phosphate 1-dehydrogenase